VLGCAAYEAGNILGGVAGAVLGPMILYTDVLLDWVFLQIEDPRWRGYLANIEAFEFEETPATLS